MSENKVVNFSDYERFEWKPNELKIMINDDFRKNFNFDLLNNLLQLLKNFKLYPSSSFNVPLKTVKQILFKLKQAFFILKPVPHPITVERRKDNSELDSFTEIIIEQGPAQYVKPLFEEHFGLDSDGDAGEKMYSKIFDKWLKLHEPYWDLNDPREYTFSATLAAYQIGASMLLEKCGY